MAGMVVTATEVLHHTIKKVTFEYTTDSVTGAATGATTAQVSGMLQRVVLDYGDTDALYDVVVNDEDSTDILHGNGANLPQADTLKDVTDGLGVILNSTLTIAVSNGGNSKVGKVHLYFTG